MAVEELWDVHVPQYYKHNKTGVTYQTTAECKDCTNAREGNIIVVYRSVRSRLTFARDKEEFLEKFTLIEADA